MTRYGRDPGAFRAHRIADRGPWKREISIAPGDIGPGWMFPGRGFWRGFGDGCRRILIDDRGPEIARPVRLAGIKGRGPRLFNYFDRGNVRCGPARAIGSGNRATRSITAQRKGPHKGGPVVLGGCWGLGVAIPATFDTKPHTAPMDNGCTIQAKGWLRLAPE